MTTAREDLVPSPGGAAMPASSGLSRRRALTGLATVGVSLPLLAACGDSTATGGPAPSAAGDPTTDPSTDPTTGPTSGSAIEEPSPAPVTGEESEPAGLTSTRDVPVGGGVILTDSQVVVTQPAAGDFKCFSAVCTHSGCTVTSVTSTIICACHNSSFDLATGEVLGGPAPAPLPPVAFTIDKDQVVLT